MAKTQFTGNQAKDADFVSETELASVSGTSGAEMTGVKDTAEHFIGSTVEDILAEIGVTIVDFLGFEDPSGGSIVLKRDGLDVLSGHVIGLVDFQAKDTDAQGGVYESVARIEARASEDFDDSDDAGTKLVFMTNVIGTETPNDNMILDGEDLTIEGFVSPKTLDLELLSGAPGFKQGRFYFNSSGEKAYVCLDGSSFTEIVTGVPPVDLTFMFSKTLILPEYTQDEVDFVPLLPIENVAFPYGILITRCGIKLDADQVYSVVFEDWSDPQTHSADISTVATLITEDEKDSGAISTTVAAGNIVGIDLPTTTGVKSLMVWFEYEVKES